MSENKDLEIIKKELHSVTGIGSSERIEKAAERMAAEIRRLKTQGKVACELFDELKILQKENFDLKDELEKRPEVVRCGECKKKDLGFTCPLACANAVIEAKTKTKNFILFDDNDFCSAGQRGESEEGK